LKSLQRSVHLESPHRIISIDSRKPDVEKAYPFENHRTFVVSEVSSLSQEILEVYLPHAILDRRR